MNSDLNCLGWLLPQELDVIASLAKKVPANGVIVEVGSMMGRSSRCWATKCDPTVTVVCIDIFYEKYLVDHNIDTDHCIKNNFPLSNTVYDLKTEFVKNTQDLSNIVTITGESPDIDYPGWPIDLFFLDASHTNPNDWQNIEYFLPLLKPQSIISGHDCDLPDVKHNIKRLENYFNRPVCIHNNTSIWSFSLTAEIVK
jgi:predicted O-methyltransferase YrrM